MHCSLRSFGRVRGGAETLIASFQEEGATLVVPSFSWTYSVPPPVEDRPTRNGTRYEYQDAPPERTVFDTSSTVVDRDMGALSLAVVRSPGRARGDHPICSFSALGPQAAHLIEGQAPRAVWAPLERLAASDGMVLLMGVDITRLTLVHLAEQRAGRRPFIRWAGSHEGAAVRVHVGSCSEGFGALDPILGPLTSSTVVGRSRWCALGAADALDLVVRAIAQDPDITRCSDAACDRCRDAVAGGPLI